LFTQFGYEVLFARDGSEAIATAISNRPNVVLLDVQLLDMSGFAVAREILKSGIIKIPMIGCSAYGEERENALRKGMMDYLQKTHRGRTIKETIEQIFQPGG
jgi:CheY-like chemotaxis protein